MLTNLQVTAACSISRRGTSESTLQFPLSPPEKDNLMTSYTRIKVRNLESKIDLFANMTYVSSLLLYSLDDLN